MLSMQQYVEKANRIWLAGAEDDLDSYWRFRRCFNLPDSPVKPISLAIAADTEFAVFINGHRLEGTQYPAYPEQHFFTVFNGIEQFLKKGRNCLAISVYHMGASNATHVKCPGGLVCVMTDGTWVLNTDNAWKVSADPAFVSGRGNWLSFPVGMRFEYDANLDENWHANDYDDSAWQTAAVLQSPNPDGAWRELSPRPVPVCREFLTDTVSIVWQGDFIQPKAPAPDAEPPEPFLRHLLPEKVIEGYAPSWFCGDDTYPIRRHPGDAPVTLLPPEGEADGISITLDLGRECVGFITLEWDCEDIGVVMEVHHGEHLDDGRVRSRIGFARFCDTIRLGSGRRSFIYPMRRVGARYLQLFITGMKNPLKLHYAGLTELEYQLPTLAPFTSPDRAAIRLRELSARTLHLCMHDHYEDCPWREQSLYTGDSRIQMLCGYYLWGNYDFAQASLELLAQRFFDDCGFLSLCAPSGDEMTIASYSFIWIAAVREFVLFSGRTEFFSHIIRQRVEQILQQALKRPLESLPGLYRASKDEHIFTLDKGGRVWNFYEWCGELSCDSRREQLLYQCYLAEALNAAADLFDWCGECGSSKEYRQKASELMAVTAQHFWDGDKELFTAFLPETSQKYYEHVQSMMLLNADLTEGQKNSLYKALIGTSLEHCTWFNWGYYAKAMAKGTTEAHRHLDKRYQEEFGRFACNGATSLWELPNGSNLGSGGGSLCHGWSAIPAWYLGAVKLGVEPITPGFRTFRVKPLCIDSSVDISGSVPTPYGFIHVEIEHGNVSVDVPNTLKQS